MGSEIESRAAAALGNLSYLLRIGWKIDYVIHPNKQFVMWHPLDPGIIVRDEALGLAVEKAMVAGYADI